MSFETLREKCLQRGLLYEDPEFPASHSSVYYSKVDKNIVWRRPIELSDSPEFVVGGVCRQDLHQGSVGNCWYIAGVATLACHPTLFQWVVPKDQGFKENYAGIFHFRFWKYGRWVEVVIDDRLPTYYGRQLIFCHNRAQPNEFWSALMEKAYAKYAGSYEALDGGWTEDALVDFTGGVGERVDLSRKQVSKGLFREILKGYRMSTLYGCSINATAETMESELSNGLVIGHAYSVTKVTKFDTQGVRHQMIRLRNPWGEREWKGPWSDRSKEWLQVGASKRQQLGLVIEEDGEFWISFEDLVTHFDQLQICHLPPNNSVEGKLGWKEHLYHGSWVKGVSAGGCGNAPNQELYWTNPQYSVTLRDVDENDDDRKCTLIVSLMQTHTRLMRTRLRTDDSTTAIGFSIYRVKTGAPSLMDGHTYDRYSLLRTETSGDFSFYREVSGHYELDPGHYVVIPATFLPNTQANFLLRMFTMKEFDSSEMDVPTGPIQVPKDSQDLLRDLFNKYAGTDKVVDAPELQKILNEAFVKELDQDQGFELEVCRSLLAMMDKDASGVLEFNELRKMWKELKVWKQSFHQSDRDQSGYVEVKELRSMFKSIGFTLSRGVLRSIVRRYGGKEGRLIFQDFVIVATKVAVMIDKFVDYSKGGIQGKAEMTLDEWMQLVLYF